MVEINNNQERFNESLEKGFHIFINYSKDLDICISKDYRFVFEIYKNQVQMNEVTELKGDFNFDEWVGVYDYKSMRAGAGLKDESIIGNYTQDTFIFKDNKIEKLTDKAIGEKVTDGVKKTGNILNGNKMSITTTSGSGEANRKYSDFSNVEKKEYWLDEFYKGFFRGREELEIDIAHYRKFEPEFDMFVEPVTELLGEIIGKDKQYILKKYFILDDLAKNYLTNSGSKDMKKAILDILDKD